MVQDILWKIDSYSTCQKIACFLHGTQRFITVFTKACHRTLSWASWIQFAPSIPTSLRSIKSHVLFPLLRSCQRISPGPRHFERLCNKLIFYGEVLLAQCQTPRLKDHPLSAVHNWLSMYSQLPSISGGLRLHSHTHTHTHHAAVTRDPSNMA
jgi:hypothetical protein